jgi:predicted Fe-Mo cluster-binding NifX family protein
MKIAFTSKGTGWDSMMDPRFGRTEYLLVYDEEEDVLIEFDNRSVEHEAHGAGPKTAQKMHELEATVLVTGNGPGGNAAGILENLGVKVYTGAGQMTVREAYEAYRNNQLKEF